MLGDADDHQQTSDFRIYDLRIADAEGEFGGDEQFETLRADLEEEAAVEFEQISRAAWRTNLGLASQFEREALRSEIERACGVGSVRAEAGQRQCFGFRQAAGVDLQHALRIEEHAVLFEHAEIGFERGHAPEERLITERVAHVEDEAAGGGADRTELVNRKLSAELQDEDVAGAIDVETDGRLHRHERFVQEIGKTQLDAAG